MTDKYYIMIQHDGKWTRPDPDDFTFGSIDKVAEHARLRYGDTYFWRIMSGGDVVYEESVTDPARGGT